MAKKTEAVKLAEIEAQKQLLRDLLNNPVMAMVAGVIILELAERAKITGSVITTTTEIGLLGVATAQAIAPLLPVITEAAAPLVKSLAVAGL